MQMEDKKTKINEYIHSNGHCINTDDHKIYADNSNKYKLNTIFGCHLCLFVGVIDRFRLLLNAYQQLCDTICTIIVTETQIKKNTSG